VPDILGSLTARQVNLALAAVLGAAFATGVSTWAIGTTSVRPVAIAHGICGLTLLVLAPAKLRGPVATGMRRGRATRWLSIAFGVLAGTTVALGVLHTTGLGHGVGPWSPLWTHVALAVVALPLFAWHVTSRPVRPRRVDMNRRLVLRGSAAAAVGAGAYLVEELVARGVGLDGADRRATGSYEIGSFDPQAMPTVSWLDDEAPDLDPERWPLEVDGRAVTLTDLRSAAEPVAATLDCTGGWWSEQSWDAVALDRLLGDAGGRALEVRSATGYARLLPRGDAGRLYLAVGYGGQRLRRGHGGPVRLVAPGRRGPWWVKWVTEVRLTDRPWWLQLPFPAT
jgi:Oxidoreductase molybdopterin binding domain